MIRHIRGEYLYYESGAIIVETGSGIGFRINVSDTSSLLTAREGDELSILKGSSTGLLGRLFLSAQLKPSHGLSRQTLPQKRKSEGDPSLEAPQGTRI